ncbi:MAG: RNA polymerase subunit sigma-70, partial [Alphaproteobacteria bacterium]|nr:RNA polymerase subunit sigma-70 [Alphaproteobacteria bacterium]
AQTALLLLEDELRAPGGEAADIPDERLRLMFVCAHPAIEPAARAPLILQTVLGFDAGTIASAFLAAPVAMAQRLVRAKRKIRDAGVPFREPAAEEMPERLQVVLEAIYAAFAEGWSDPLGSQRERGALAAEAIWLGRLVCSLLPVEPEALGLLALMLHAEARRPARRSPAGEYVPLADQDPRCWDAALIAEAEAVLRQASVIGRPGRFQLEAAVQSAHAARRLSGRTDWAAIVAMYDALAAMTGSVVVAINRAVALGELLGPSAGLRELDVLDADPRLADYQPYWAARAELLARSGEAVPAALAYDRAIGLADDAAVRRFLQQRQAAVLAPGAQRGGTQNQRGIRKDHQARGRA